MAKGKGEGTRHTSQRTQPASHGRTNQLQKPSWLTLWSLSLWFLLAALATGWWLSQDQGNDPQVVALARQVTAGAFIQQTMHSSDVVSLKDSFSHCPENKRQALARHLKPLLTQVTKIDAYYTDIGVSGAQALAPALEHMTQITSLGLMGINLGPEGAKAIAPALRKLTLLTALDLSHNRIGPEGAKAMARGLRSLTHLTSLQLSVNDMGPETLGVVAELRHTPLSVLYLYSNKLGIQGATTLLPLLQQLTLLTTLDLRDNSLDPDTRETLRQSLSFVSNLGV